MMQICRSGGGGVTRGSWVTNQHNAQLKVMIYSWHFRLKGGQRG